MRCHMRGGAAAVEQARLGEHAERPADVLATRMPRSAMRRPDDQRRRTGRRRPRTLPPTMINVVIADDGFRPRASISTPDELRTGPAFTAIVLMSGALPASQAAISNAAIRPAAHQEQLEVGEDKETDHRNVLAKWRHVA